MTMCKASTVNRKLRWFFLLINRWNACALKDKIQKKKKILKIFNLWASTTCSLTTHRFTFKLIWKIKQSNRAAAKWINNSIRTAARPATRDVTLMILLFIRGVFINLNLAAKYNDHTMNVQWLLLFIGTVSIDHSCVHFSIVLRIASFISSTSSVIGCCYLIQFNEHLAGRRRKMCMKQWDRKSLRTFEFEYIWRNIWRSSLIHSVHQYGHQYVRFVWNWNFRYDDRCRVARMHFSLQNASDGMLHVRYLNARTRLENRRLFSTCTTYFATSEAFFTQCRLSLQPFHIAFLFFLFQCAKMIRRCVCVDVACFCGRIHSIK